MLFMLKALAVPACSVPAETVVSPELASDMTISVPAPVFSSGRGVPAVSSTGPDWVAVPVSTCSWVWSESRMIVLAISTPAA